MEPKTRRNRGAVLAAVAATVLGAGAVALTTDLIDHRSSPKRPNVAGSAPVAAPTGVLTFRITLQPGERLVGGGVGSRGEQNAHIDTPHGAVDLATQPPLERGDWRLDPAATRVTVHAADGYYGGGFEARYADFHEDESASSPGATRIPPAAEANPRQPGLRTLAWQYRSGNWATLRSTARRVTEQDLVALAENVDFAARTPMRIAISMERIPEGLVRTGWDSRYLPTDDDPDVAAIRFATTAHYEDVSVELVRGELPADVRQLAFTVHDRRAYTAPGYGAVVLVAEEPGYYLQVSAVYPTDGSSYTPRTLEPIADLVTVAADPADTDSWFDASTAVP